MDREARRHFEQILTLAHRNFSDVQVRFYDISARRAILKLTGAYGDKRVEITEILTPQVRKYSYYLLRSDLVLLGLDNSEDRQALRLKYGTEFVQHLYEPVPHLHTENKRKLTLTEQKSFADFMEMVLEFEELEGEERNLI